MIIGVCTITLHLLGITSLKEKRSIVKSVVARLRNVPDSVGEFTGYFIPWDPIAGSGGDAARDDDDALCSW